MPATTKRAAANFADKSEDRIPSLLEDLASSDQAVRMRARMALISIGNTSVPYLIQLLSHRKPHVRWEAAKTLVGIADPISVSALVNALDDCDGEVRWLASEGVAALGRDGLQALLSALLVRAQSCWFCEGARHVCHSLAKRKRLSPILRPVLAALGKIEPQVAAPLAAYNALSKLRELS